MNSAMKWYSKEGYTMEYENDSRESLLKRIEELETLNRELLKEKEHEKNLEFGWKGNLGHWYWNVKTNSVVFNELKVTNLGYKKEDIPQNVTYQFFTELLHPKDYDRVMDCMKKHMQGLLPAYEVEYRIRAKDGSYHWYYDRGKIMEYDKDGKPLIIAGIVFDISETKKMEEKYYKLAVKDPLTNVYNRRYFTEQMNQILSFSEKNDTMPVSFSLAMIDIDDFKQINDSFNHLYGDFILQRITCCILGFFEPETLIARWGGDEFIVCLKNCAKENAIKWMQQLEEKIHQIQLPNGRSVTISIGIVQYEKGMGMKELIEKADEFLYQSKRCGKNCIC